jgi:hypothetical protein
MTISGYGITIDGTPAEFAELAPDIIKAFLQAGKDIVDAAIKDAHGT